MEKQHSRRAALVLFAAAPALAILLAAAGPPSTSRLSELIAAHRAARAAFCEAIDALEAAEPDKETRIPGFGDKFYRAGDRYDNIVAHIGHDYAKEIEKTATISALSPALGEQAHPLGGNGKEGRRSDAHGSLVSALRRRGRSLQPPPNRLPDRSLNESVRHPVISLAVAKSPPIAIE